MEEYPKRLVELYEVLKYMSDEDKEKIPQDLKEAIETGRDENYTWVYDESKPLAEQDLHPDTVAMLTHINMEYILTEEQKENVRKTLASNKKKNKINSDLIPQEIHVDESEPSTEVVDENEEKIDESEENSMVPVKEHKSIFKRIAHFFMDLFINSDFKEN